MMNTLIATVRRNKPNYDCIISRAVIDVDTDYAECKAIIGVRGRGEFVRPVATSFIRAGIPLTIVEYSPKLQHIDICRSIGVNYIGVECGATEPYSRSLPFNVGACVVGECKWLITHDIDCLVQSTFGERLLQNAEKKQALAMQSFNKRRVLYCNEELTGSLLRQDVSVEQLHEGYHGIFTCQGQAPGGSIFIDRDLFFKIGGYDPCLFWGYAPEDRFFWVKMSLFTRVYSADDPPVDIFHMHHPFMGNSNPQLRDMIRVAERFERLPREEQLKYVALKEEILAKWK